MRPHGKLNDTRILSQGECEALFQRILHFGTGDAETMLSVRSTWTANVRWGRNRPTSSGDTVEQSATLIRSRGDREIQQVVGRFDDISLKDLVQTMDHRLATGPTPRSAHAPDQPADQSSDQPDDQSDSVHTKTSGPLVQPRYLTPQIWSDTTAHMTVQDLSSVVRRTIPPVVEAHQIAAGYAEISAASWGVFDSTGLTAYATATGALYSETVRATNGTASGWAGQSHMAWDRLDVHALSTVALQKCLASANPVALEPGRYTTILEPQVVACMFDYVLEVMELDQAMFGKTAFSGTTPRTTKIGTRVFDARISITSDPTDSECGYLPFDPEGNPYTQVTWVEHGILKNLAYSRAFANQYLGTNVALPNPHAFRVSGGDTSIEEMIQTTERGVLVTRTNGLTLLDPDTISEAGITRDGLWLIERGKITHPIENFWFTESPMTVFNRIVQIGPAIRTYGVGRLAWGGNDRGIPAYALNDGHAPIVAPPIKVNDFNFLRLTSAI